MGIISPPTKKLNCPMLYNRFVKLRLTFIFVVSLAFGLLGAGISLLLPNQYTAKGLLIVTRKAEPPASGYFTYEGSYAQQSSKTYTETFMSILHSPASLASANTGLEIKKLGRLVKVKREGSQGVSLAVKASKPLDATLLWNKIADSAISTHTKLMDSEDPLITVAKTPGSPTIIDTYPDWQTVFGATFGFSAVIVSATIAVIRYLKGEDDY